MKSLKNILPDIISISVLLIIFIILALLSSGVGPTKISIILAAVPTIAIAIYFWSNEKQYGDDARRDYIDYFVLGVIWTIISVIAISLIYGLSIVDILMFSRDAWSKVSYLGVLAIGPLIVIVSIASLLRIYLKQLFK